MRSHCFAPYPRCEPLNDDFTGDNTMSTSMSSLRRFPSLGAALAGLLMAASISAMAEPVTL